MPAPPDIMELDEDGSEGGRLIRGGIYRGSGSDAGRPAIPQHFQYGGGCGGESLGVHDGGRRGRAR